MKLIAAFALAAFSAGAVAAPHCTDAPRALWMPEQSLKDRLVTEGYTIDKFKVSGQCYEIYGKDPAGERVEIYFDPTDGRVVKRRGN